MSILTGINAEISEQAIADCLLSPNFDLESTILLFVTAWESLRDYSKTAYREAQKDYNRWENQQQLEFIESQTLSPYERERRKRRQLDNFDPDEPRQLHDKLYEATRFKIDCEKGLIQSTEWSRFLRAQQRRLRAPKQ